MYVRLVAGGRAGRGVEEGGSPARGLMPARAEIKGRAALVSRHVERYDGQMKGSHGPIFGLPYRSVGTATSRRCVCGVKKQPRVHVCPV